MVRSDLMARKENVERTIGDVRFRVSQLGFDASRKLFVRLSKRVGPGLARLAGGDVPGGLAALVEALEDADLVYATDVLGDVSAYSTNDGKAWPSMSVKANRDLLFDEAGLSVFFGWLAFALEVQYADFSAALGRLVGPAPARATPGPSSESRTS